MRCSAYSSATNHPLHVPSLTESELSRLPSKEQADYTEKKRVSAIEHFGDKLLHIKDRLKVRAMLSLIRKESIGETDTRWL